MNLLTNRISLLVFSTLFVLASCGDDEEDTSRRDLLIGSWEIQSGELVDYQVTVENFGQIDKDNIEAIALVLPQVREVVETIEDGTDILFPPESLITFNDDNTFELNDQTEVSDGTWSLSSDEENINVQVNNDLGINQLEFYIRTLTSQVIEVDLQVDENDINLESIGVDELPADIESFSIDYSFSFQKQ